MKKLIILAAVVFGFAATTFAQNTVNKTTLNLTANASVVKPLTVTSAGNLEFGKFYSPAYTNTDLLITPASGFAAVYNNITPDPSSTSGIVITYSGKIGVTPTVILPADGTLKLNSMPASTLATPIPLNVMQTITPADGLGNGFCYVGGQIFPALNQFPANYATTFNVTLQYP